MNLDKLIEQEKTRRSQIKKFSIIFFIAFTEVSQELQILVLIENFVLTKILIDFIQKVSGRLDLDGCKFSMPNLLNKVLIAHEGV